MKKFISENRLYLIIAGVAIALAIAASALFSQESWTGTITYQGFPKLKELLSLVGSNTVLNYFLIGILLIGAVSLLAVFFSRMFKSNSEFSDVRKLTIVGIFSGLAFILIFIGFPFILDFLKIDFSPVIILLVMILVDYKTGILTGLIVAILDYLVKGSSVGFPIDQFAYFLAVFCFLTTFHLLTNKKDDTRSTIIGLVGSVLVTTVVMVFLNYVWILPVYVSLYGMDSVISFAGDEGVFMNLASSEFLWIVGVFGTFNIVKWGLVAVGSYLTLRSTRAFIKRLN